MDSRNLKQFDVGAKASFELQMTNLNLRYVKIACINWRKENHWYRGYYGID